MKKRIISSITLFCMVIGLCATTSIAAEPVTEEPVTVVAFENYSATQDSLTSEVVSSMESTAICTSSDGRLQVVGSIPEGDPYNISIYIENGEFTAATEEENNYSVLSVIPFDSTIRIILEDNGQKNMYYIEMEADEFATVKPYNVNWYHSFLAPEVETIDLPSPNTITSANKYFTTSTSIYGDEYVEKLTIKFSNDWDNPVSPGVGYTAITKMTLQSKTTEITRYGSSNTTVVDGNSLFVNRVNYTATSPYGEYFRKVETQYTGTVYRNGSVGIGVGIAIPHTPFSIDLVSLPTSETETLGSSATYFDLDNYADAPKMPMAIKVDYTDSNIWMEEADNEGSPHNIVIESSLKTHDNYIRYERKGFAYRWDYYVASDGNCNGVAVTMISEPQSFRNTLYYDLEP